MGKHKLFYYTENCVVIITQILLVRTMQRVSQ